MSSAWKKKYRSRATHFHSFAYAMPHANKTHFIIWALCVSVNVYICVNWFGSARAHMSARLSSSSSSSRCTVWLRHGDFFSFVSFYFSSTLCFAMRALLFFYCFTTMLLSSLSTVRSLVRSLVCFCFAFNALNVFFSLSLFLCVYFCIAQS